MYSTRITAARAIMIIVFVVICFSFTVTESATKAAPAP
jgi:hypothetical protein